MSATEYERRQAVAVYCEYCCATPGVRCAAYNGPDASTWKPARTHMLRVYAWRRACVRRELRGTPA